MERALLAFGMHATLPCGVSRDGRLARGNEALDSDSRQAC
jgi:hypothetical protein